MQKPLVLSIAACLALSGCHVFEKSETWTQAVKVRPAETTLDPDPSNAYAIKLHDVLGERGIEHKVVVYQYHYTTRQREEGIGTRTAVVYRDNSNPQYPWWLKDDRLNKPVWLPNGALDTQVSFYIRRKAEVLEVKDYPAKNRDGKTTIAFSRPAPALRPSFKTRLERAVTTILPARKAAAPVAAEKPAPTTTIVHRAEAAPQPAKLAEVRNPTHGETHRLPEVAAGPSSLTGARNSEVWVPPATLDADEQPSHTAPRDSQLEKLFRAKHGTDYNRFSPEDRRKMQQLQKGVASRE